ncbi:MAG: hypothetical protein ACKVS6_14065 [Planctomycetota bacterium]
MNPTPRTLLAGVFFLTIFAFTAYAAADSFKVIDRTKVYFGLADAFVSPAVIESSKVMETIPAIKTIQNDGIKKDTARWFVLMNEANQQFQKAIKSVAKDNGYDLVSEVGSVSGSRTIKNITDSVIAAAKN